MPMCINCGSDKVERQGDAFTCHKCQFQWDVAFEQANRVYLRAQGRQPATSVLENPANAASGVLTTTLGQTDVGVIPTDTPVATADQPAGVGQSPWAATTSPATPPAVVPAAHLSFGSVGSDAAANGAQVEPADDPEPPIADPLPKAAATPAPDVRPPSKGKKG